MTRRGVLLAGGSGSRLHPLTLGVSKQLLPVYDKPLVYYPLTTLMLAGLAEILIISSPRDTPRLQTLLGDGSQWGISLEYAHQPAPRGIADGLLIADSFLDGRPSALILGDNIFYGHGLADTLRRAAARTAGATILAYHVQDAASYGVVELDPVGSPVHLQEKPTMVGAGLAVTGLYFYDESAVERAQSLQPSERGELEITDLNLSYLEDGSLTVEVLHRGFAWLDAGTPRRLHDASTFVATVQERQGLLIASPEEIAYRTGLIDRKQLLRLAYEAPESEYGNYLRRVADETPARLQRSE